ncbi:hypothetical protein [Streptosporangium sp. NPDC006007]|uniref:hypothetical protein n=1 Tax=Streptosporangium sp. NPDC006007 TaxID=3154575 RepID=UPI0033AC981A
MALITVAGVVAVLAMLGGLVKLLDGGEAKPATRSAGSPTLTAAIVSNIPRPNARQAEELLYGLRRIDPELDRARSIGRARNTCSDLLHNEPRAAAVERTRLRFDGIADIDATDARAIVKLIETGGWCR